MSKNINKIDVVIIILKEYDEDEKTSLLSLISNFSKFKNFGNIYVYSKIENLDFLKNCNIDIRLNELRRHNTGDALLSILRNKRISNDFILSINANDYNLDVLEYMFKNPNSFAVKHVEFPNPYIKLDEFNRIESVEFKEYNGFGYESLGLLRLNLSKLLTLVHAYHLEFWNEEDEIYLTSNEKGFNILDLFNHTNWGIFAFDIFNIENFDESNESE